MSALTAEEQANVRVALKFLRTRCGGAVAFAKVLRFKPVTIDHVLGGQKNVSAEMAFRVARIASVGVDDLLAGKYPAVGVCPHCGNAKEAS